MSILFPSPITREEARKPRPRRRIGSRRCAGPLPATSAPWFVTSPRWIARMGIVIAATLPAVTIPHSAAAQTPAPAQQAKVALITGSTSGLGREVALRLGASGWHVIVHGRDEARGAEVVAEIEKTGGSARFFPADLASLAEVRQLADVILARYPRLDLLINNAGIGSRVPDNRALSADGHELRFAVNYLSHFLLTHLLLPRLRESAPARIINVASIGQAPIDFDDVMMEREFSGSRAYGQSKLSQIMFTIDLASELAGTGITVFSLHPATYMDTGMVRAAGITPRSSVDEGAAAVMHLVMTEGLDSGAFFNGTEPARANAQAYDAAARARLRALSRSLTGLDRDAGQADPRGEDDQGGE